MASVETEHLQGQAPRGRPTPPHHSNQEQLFLLSPSVHPGPSPAWRLPPAPQVLHPRQPIITTIAAQDPEVSRVCSSLCIKASYAHPAPARCSRFWGEELESKTPGLSHTLMNEEQGIFTEQLGSWVFGSDPRDPGTRSCPRLAPPHGQRLSNSGHTRGPLSRKVNNNPEETQFQTLPPPKLPTHLFTVQPSAL